jgi:glutathione synthase/RimK-type ligase-like ATP-grasp enzyme
LNIGDLARWELSSDLTGRVQLLGDAHATVEAGSTIWWRRPGWLYTSDMASDEAHMAEAEAWTLFTGLLRSSDARTIDPPMTIAAAEDKLHQIRVARALGLMTPETLVTSSPADASAFTRRGPTLAKSASSGPGLAPHVDSVGQDALDLVRRVPVLLQRATPAIADVRIVTVRDSAYVWRRERSAQDPWDWRAVDPDGHGFRPSNDEASSVGAVQIARALGLTFSVQDWLAAERDSVFLEVNPQGQWLFLDRSVSIVAPALARHLFQA